MSIFKLSLPKGVLISLLIIVILVFYSLNSLLLFYKFKEMKQRVGSDIELTIGAFHLFLRSKLEDEKIRLLPKKHLSDLESQLKTFRLTANKKDLDSLNINLPDSGKDHTITAYLSISGEADKIRKVKLRYRGDNNIHWLYAQKSLRIKLASNDLYDMEKTFNLINPPYDYSLIDVLNYNISSSLGLLTPEFYPVRVFLNSEFMGVYMYLSQVDESLLRKNKRMPGSIYYGDDAPANEEGVSSLWYEEKYWKKKAARNSEQKLQRDDIRYFLDSIANLDSIGFYKFAQSSLELKQYFTYFALDVIFGSEHHDFKHNHKIYFDPYKGKFEPIQWDLRFWHPYSTKDVSVYPLIQKISLNPILEYQRDQVSYDLMTSDFFKQKNIEARIADIINIQYADLEHDNLKDRAIYDSHYINTWYAEKYSMQDLAVTIKSKLQHYKSRQQKLIKIYQDAEIKYNITHLNNNKYLLEVLSTGNSPVEITLKDNSKHTLYRDSNFNKNLDVMEQVALYTDLLYPGRKIMPGTTEQFAKILSGATHIVPAAQYYSFIVQATDNVFSLSDLIFTNKITAQFVENIELQKTLKRQKSDSIHAWELATLAAKTEILEGLIQVDKSLVFDQQTTVIIKPGTVFKMAEKQSLFFYGKVLAIGTKAQPIKFIAKQSNKPWGVVALQGQATTGSRFEYVEFAYGSIATRKLIHYTAPFNIHDMDQFELSYCKIGQNFIGDDAMHIAYAKGEIDHCEFTHARSDGLDIDISEVSISNSVFYQSGNDGLDIMTTQLKASNNVFIEMGDKGISVGEWSTADINDSLFLHTSIGLEVKDKSRVTANNLIYIESLDKAINLYNKNARYDEGGFLEADKLYFLANSDVIADKKSAYHIHQSFKEELPNLKEFIWYQQLKPFYKQKLKAVTDKYAH